MDEGLSLVVALSIRQALFYVFSLFPCQFLGQVAVLYQRWSLAFSIINHPARGPHSNDKSGLRRRSKIHWFSL